jgi:hypothetical protein
VAERLAAIDPADYSDIEDLRQELLDVIEERLDETELMLFAQADQQFHFVRSIIVQFDTRKRLAHPRELVGALPGLSVGSVFYHFIDARRRESLGVDDFRAWLEGLGPTYQSLCEDIAEVDPYFDSLFVLREKLGKVITAHLGDRRSPGAPGPSGEAPA